MNNPGLHLSLGSNIAPNTHEAFFRLQVDDLTSQISQLRSRLAELEDQLAVLSPIRRMPAEVLGQIFVLFLPDVLQDGARNTLVDIQLVCKSWRDAARLTHSLWGALSFEDVINVSFKKIKQWYNRAGGTPKSLTFSARYHNNCSESQSLACGSLPASTLTALLVELEGTLDHLSLAYKGPKCFQNFLNSLGPAEEGTMSLQRRPWHRLKSFAIEFNGEWHDSPGPLRSMFDRLPPNITTLELHLPHRWSDAFAEGSDSENALLPLPKNLLEQLSSFTLSCSWDGTQWLEDALGHCVNVETLTMDLTSASWSCDRSRPSTERVLNSGVLLPKVRTLRLQNVWIPSIDILFTLKAPQLVELDIDFQPGDEDDEPDWVDFQPLLSFVDRSKCDATLRILHLRNARIKSRELAATLGSLPFLTHLSLEGIIMEHGATFVDAFDVYENPESRLLPNLETLELLQLPPDFSKYRLFTFLMRRRPYRIEENGQPLFLNPQDSFRRLKVVYQPTTKEKQELEGSYIVETLRKRGGVSFDIGPILYVD